MVTLGSVADDDKARIQRLDQRPDGLDQRDMVFLTRQAAHDQNDFVGLRDIEASAQGRGD